MKQVCFDTETRLGKMRALSDGESLLRLEFVLEDSPAGPAWEMKHETVKLDDDSVLQSTYSQVMEYLHEGRITFTIPLRPLGTIFQKSVWAELSRIPFGQTRSYREQAVQLGNPLSIRAVAAANGTNPLCIIIPCHRVLGSDGSLTGYAGGLFRKAWLLRHEGYGQVQADLFDAK